MYFLIYIFKLELDYYLDVVLLVVSSIMFLILKVKKNLRQYFFKLSHLNVTTKFFFGFSTFFAMTSWEI